MTLATESDEDDIYEVFEFVEDDCELNITCLSSSSELVVPSVEGEYPEEKITPAQTEKYDGIDRRSSAGDRRTSSIRVDLDRIDKLVNMVGELVITQAMLTQEVETSETQSPRLLTGMEELAAHSRELQENVMSIRMQPVKSVFSRMPRLVRDLSKQLNKKVKLEVIGETTEVDKTVIEKIADPLTHMIRNSLDHGIEDSEVRRENGKNPVGTIVLSAEHRGGRIIIEVSDDGAGINRERVLKKALEKGLVDSEDISDEEIDNLIFHPGFSTAESVTDVSGRGVGMDVVRKNILALGGRVTVVSKSGIGSKFTMALPLTLAVLDGMIVGVGEEKYVIPVNSILESIRPTPEEVTMLFGDTRVVQVRGEYFPLVAIADLFGVEGAELEPSKALVVIVEMDSGNKVGVVVDALIGQQQVVIKSLESNYQRIEGFSAATILGNGQVCLIIDIDSMEEMERSKRGGMQLTQRNIEKVLHISQQ